MQHLEDSGTPVLYIGLTVLNPLNPELNPICYLLALLGAHHFLHFSRIGVKLLIFRQGRSPAEILGSNPTGGMDICLLWVSCVVR